MLELIASVERVHRSYLSAIDEFRDSLQDGGHHQPRELDYVENRFMDGDASWLAEPTNFAVYVQRIRADALPETPRPEGRVPASHLWLVDEDEYLGALDIRHQMTDFLLNAGGLIGYDIRPSARGRGRGKWMLAAALPIANTLGHDPVLVTCDTTNHASSGVIKANHGVLEDERNGKLRFWVPTSTP